MKRCPDCRRDYYDDTLVFCLDDGATLLDGPAHSESRTAIFAAGAPNESPMAILTGRTDEAPTREMIETAEQTRILPADAIAGRKTEELPGQRSGRLWLAAVLVAVLAIGGFFGYRYLTPKGGQITSIAVMPFENRNSDADTDYLSDGLAESLIFRLTQIPDLKVSPTSSVMRYKGKETDVAKIAAELGVDAVMTGRVTKRGDNLNIAVELVDARNNKSLWGEQYERKLSELLSTQREIATTIVEKLQFKLGGTDTKGLTKNYTQNNEAYQSYLRGRFSWSKRTHESLKQAIEFYEQAIALDPDFALAYSGLAETYVLFSFYGVEPAKQCMPKAKAAIDKALSLDDSLAEAHAARGNYLTFYEYDRAGAEREFRRAIELNPKFATAHHWLGLNALALTRRFDESVTEITIAAETDPQSPVIGADKAMIFVYAGRFDEAILQAQKTVELDPDFAHAHAMLGYALQGKGRYAEAIAEFEKSISLSDDGYARSLLVRALVDAGRRGDAERQLEAMRTLGSKRYVPDFCFAIAYTALGDKETAIKLLEKEVEERSSFVATISVEVALNDLRNDPRFKELLKKVGTPE